MHHSATHLGLGRCSLASRSPLLFLDRSLLDLQPPLNFPLPLLHVTVVRRTALRSAYPIEVKCFDVGDFVPLAVRDERLCEAPIHQELAGAVVVSDAMRLASHLLYDGVIVRKGAPFPIFHEDRYVGPRLQQSALLVFNRSAKQGSTLDRDTRSPQQVGVKVTCSKQHADVRMQ